MVGADKKRLNPEERHQNIFEKIVPRWRPHIHREKVIEVFNAKKN